MNLSNYYRHFISQLQHIYSAHEAANITAMCFEKVAGFTKSDVIKNPEYKLDEEPIKILESHLASLLLHKPIQYVLEEAWFCKMKFKVNENVLIPRPETEELVNEVTAFISDSSALQIIDIGTGSGCIPIALKKRFPDATIKAVDIDQNAISIAEENAKNNKCEITFIQADFLNKKCWNDFGNFDIIISNPPYIPISEKKMMDKNVTDFEPHLALFVADEKPFIFYEAIALFSKMHLNENGKLFLEVHENLSHEVAELLNAQSFQTEIKKDIFGKERMVMATHYRHE